jgi:hypothetical protein
MNRRDTRRVTVVATRRMETTGSRGLPEPNRSSVSADDDRNQFVSTKLATSNALLSLSFGVAIGLIGCVSGGAVGSGGTGGDGFDEGTTGGSIPSATAGVGGSGQTATPPPIGQGSTAGAGGASSTTGAGPGASTSAGAGGSSGSGGGGSPVVANCPVFPSDNAWNTDISQYPVHPSSDAIVDSIGRSKHAHPDFGSSFGIPFAVVPGGQAMVPVSFDYASESDPGPYPIPANVAVEADSDAHVLVVDQGNCLLYELWSSSTPDGGQSWQAGSGAVWDLSIDDTRPLGWTSADAAGLPVFPGLVRYEELASGSINHALRFTVSHSRAGYVTPATHWASSDTSSNLPAMGMRFRMKASFDCSGYSQDTQVLCTTLKRYGMILADNGSDWYISGAPNPSYDDSALDDAKLWTGDAFEVVYTGDVVTD